jgi:dephospho-CoA kinase
MGSGKTTLSKTFRDWGYPCIFADQIGHSLLDEPPIREQLKTSFGESIFAPDGTIDRNRLGARVFSDSNQRLLLNSILHPIMVERILQLRHAYEQSRASLLFVEAAIIKEMGLIPYMDHILVVEAAEAIRINRGTKYRGLTESEISARDRVQNHDLGDLSIPVTVLENDGNLPSLIHKARAFLSTIGIDPLSKR